MSTGSEATTLRVEHLVEDLVKKTETQIQKLLQENKVDDQTKELVGMEFNR